MLEPNRQSEIPNIYHFIWLGAPTPFFLVLAIQSVLARCKDARVKLWTDEERTRDSQLEELNQHPRFETITIKVEQLIDQLYAQPVKTRIAEIFGKAGTKTLHAERKPVERSRSNLLRYLILYHEGGIYLDADTIVTKDLSPLRTSNSAFIGSENSIWAITRRNNPFYYFIWAPFLEIFRLVAILLPFGYLFNHTFRRLCSPSANNAVIGMTPKHNFMKACMEFITTMDNKEIVLPLRLGPFLFQRVAQQYHAHDLTVYPESYFYPYGPMMSQHFFKKRNNPQKVLASMLDETNYVVHWGASTKTLKAYAKDTILDLKNKSVFSLLQNRVIEEYEIKKY